MTQVSGSFVATGNSASYAALPGNLDGHGRDFNVSIGGTFVGTVYLDRSPDAGTTWIPASKSDLTDLSATAPVTFTVHEDTPGAIYRLRCSAWTSGAISYWIGA